MTKMQRGGQNVTVVMAGSSPSESPKSPLAPRTTPAGEDAETSAHTPGPSPGGRGEQDAPTPGPSTILSRATGGRGETEVASGAFPPLATQAANLFQSVVAFVGDGCGIVDDVQHAARLEICRTCERRSGNRCAACGCWINVKARGRVFRCPIGRWE